MKSIRSGEVSIKYFKAMMGDPPPERTILMARHYDNQFQVPILFLITCVVHLLVGIANPLTLGLAWGFVLSRFFHSAVMLGSNNVADGDASLVSDFIFFDLVF